MELNYRQRRILTGVLLDQEHLSSLPTGRDIGLSGDDLGRRRIRVRDAQAGLVPMNLDGWLGRVPSNSDAVMYCREYERLEHMGLLERHNVRGGRRTSHLKLTPTGRRVAEELLAQEFGDRDPDADSTVDWSNVELMPIEMPLDIGEAPNDSQ